MNTNITLDFPEVAPAEATQLAEDLREYLLRTNNIEGNVVKERSDTQDAGSILTIILGAGSTLAIAKGIGYWIKMQAGKKVRIKETGEIIGENLSTKDIELILQKVKPK